MFIKSKLAIAESPFDLNALFFSIGYGSDYIDLIPGSIHKIPEQVYSLKQASETELILATTNWSEDTIYYHFTNEKSLLEEFDPNKEIIEMGVILIRHLKLDDGKGVNRVSSYLISNSKQFLNPRPTFRGYSFGQFFSTNFEFPNNFPTDSLSSELIVDLDILPKGITNVQIVKGINDDFDRRVLKVFEKTQKKWMPLTIEKEKIKSKVRFRYYFYLGRMNTKLFDK